MRVNHASFLLVVGVAGFSAFAGEQAVPLQVDLARPVTDSEAEVRATAIMHQMTPEERFTMVCGAGLGIPGVPRIGVPALTFCDASGGRRLAKDSAPDDRSTAFPCTELLAATWDRELAAAYGKAVGEEFRAAGVHFILGPGMNIYRNSRNSRNFEYLGEDPYLAAEMVSGYVEGAQGVGVAVTLKHFICNDTERYRRSTNALVEERALHEIYLPPFEAGIKAGAWAIMTAYNAVNGQWAGQNHWLVTDLLRHQLGFKNLVMTDWGATWNGELLARSGVDLEMPDGYSLKLDRAAVFGSVDVDRMVVDILRTGLESGLYELERDHAFRQSSWVARYPEHVGVSLRANEEGIVLLKNSGMLPLKVSDSGRILVTGNAALRRELSGGGSGHVAGYNLSNYLDAIHGAFPKRAITYSDNPTAEELSAADQVLVFTGWEVDEKGQRETEGLDHSFRLPQNDLIVRCTTLNRHVTVILCCGTGVEMDWADRANAILLAFYGGQTGPDAMAAILTGRITPSGKLPFTIERRFEDSCAAADESNIVGSSMVASGPDLKRRIPASTGSEFLHNLDKTEIYTRDLQYREGVLVGYRWFDAKAIAPRYPFGFGLSYARFSYSRLEIERRSDGSGWQVSFDVSNSGSVAGDAIPELYTMPPNSDESGIDKELKNFTRLHLKVGQTRHAAMALPLTSLRHWSVASHDWVPGAGDYRIGVGDSSADLPLLGHVFVK